MIASSYSKPHTVSVVFRVRDAFLIWVVVLSNYVQLHSVRHRLHSLPGASYLKFSKYSARQNYIPCVIGYNPAAAENILYAWLLLSSVPMLLEISGAYDNISRVLTCLCRRVPFIWRIMIGFRLIVCLYILW